MKTGRWTSALLLGGLLLLLAGSSGLQAQATGELTEIRVLPGQPGGDVTHLEIRASGADDMVHNLYSNPDRLVVDVSGVRHRLPDHQFDNVNRGGIHQIRTSQREEDVVRVVFDLKRKNKVYVNRTEGGFNLYLLNPSGDFQGWSTGQLQAGHTGEESRATRRADRSTRQAPTSSSAQTRPQRTEQTSDQRSGAGSSDGMTRDSDTRVVDIAQNGSAVLDLDYQLERVSISNPEIAKTVVVGAKELLVNGKQSGTTTMVLWGKQGQRTIYSINVTADVGNMDRQLERMFPNAGIDIDATGNTVVLSGRTDDPRIAQKARQLAQSFGEGIQIIDNIVVPDPGQVLLRVRFAEVNRSAMEAMGTRFVRRGDDVEGQIGVGQPAPEGGHPGDGPSFTFSDAVNFFLFQESSGLAGFISALQQKGVFKSLAEPNLLAIPGQEASFLAGGEFPFPVVQGGGGGGNQSISVEFREFGVRLAFKPEITNSGSIRLQVAPEVSTLDFSRGLQVAGHQIPAVNSRRAQTVIELNSGQTFAIAGLIDNQLQETVNKVPVLGDIPLLGELFRSKDMQQNRSELLVLVTPQIVRPTEEVPDLPGGDASSWEWQGNIKRHMEDSASSSPDSVWVPGDPLGELGVEEKPRKQEENQDG